MMREGIRVSTVSVLVSVLLLGSLAVGATAAGDRGVPDEETVEIEDNVTVWERAALPLRADTEAGATVVDSHRVRVSAEDGEPTLRSDLAIFDEGSSVDVTFSDVDGADTSSLANESVSVLVGHTDDRRSSSTGESTVPTGVEDARHLLEEVDRSQGEDGPDFERDSIELDERGEGTFELDAEDPGHYSVVFVHGTVFEREESGGSVSLADDPNGTIVGVEIIPVQSDQSTVDVPEGIEPGEDATFDVGAFEDGGVEGGVSHSVVLYDEATFTGPNATTWLNVTSEVDEEFSGENLIVEHTIAELNGVVDVETGVDGSELAPNLRESGTIPVEAILEGAAPVTGLDGLETEVAGDVSLDASAVVVTGANASERLTVETFGNWTDGEYRYVHVATRAGSSGSFETSTGTVSVATSAEDGSDGGPGPGPIGGGSGPEPVPGGDRIAVDVAEFDAGTIEAVAGEPFSLTVTVRNAEDRAGTRELVLADGDVELDRTTVDLGPGESRELTFTGTVDEAGTYDFRLDGQQVGSVAVSESSAPIVLLTDVWLSESTIEAGGSGTVTATVTNEGNTAAEQTLQLLVDGEAVDERTVELSAGESDEIQFTRPFDDPGEYEVAVDDTEAGTLTVQATQGPSGDGGTTTLIVLLGIAFVLAVAGMGGYLYATGELDSYIEEE